MTQTHRAITDDQLLAGWEKGEQAAWEQGDTSGFDNVYSDDLVYHLPPFPDVDKAGLRETASVFHKAWPDFQFQLDEQFATDSTTVYRCAATATSAASRQCSPRPRQATKPWPAAR